MDRTLRAALVAALIGLVVVGGMAWFLGLPTSTAAVSGLVAAVLFGGLIVLAARRADDLAPPSTTSSAPRDGATPVAPDDGAGHDADGRRP